MLTAVKRKWGKLRANLNLKSVIHLIWAEAKGWAVLAFGFILLESIAFLISLYFLKGLIELVSHSAEYAGQAREMVIAGIIKAAIAAVFYVLVKVISGYINEGFSSKVSMRINDKIHACALNLDLTFFESPDYYDILKRAKSEGPERPKAVIANIAEILKNLFMFLAIGSVLIATDWMLIPLVALIVMPTFLVRTYFANQLFSLQVKRTSLERKSSYISSLITDNHAVKEVKVYGLGDYLRSSYLGIQMKIMIERFRINRKSAISEIIASCLSTVGFFSCIGYICLGVINHNTSIGDITLFLVVFPQSFGLMQSLANGISSLYQNNIFISNLFVLFDLKSTLSEPDRPIYIPETADINFEVQNISFTYPHSDRPVLKDISLNIPAGKIIAVVGLNGAGKTTLIKLLCRFYDPTQGKITMNGSDIRDIDYSHFRKHIGVVFQDYGCYNMTVSDNIHLGDIGRIPEKDGIEHAAKDAGIHDLVQKLPDGYNTMLGRVFEGGQEISIGQWQKMAIARALYSPARFLILDEATSALDVLAENNFFHTLRERLGNRGALIISHRLSTIKQADYIYVLSEGRIKQAGTHDQLIKETGDYARLFKNPAISNLAFNGSESGIIS